MAQIIAVTGNSGKTTFSMFLGGVLAGDKRVIVVSTDDCYPTNCILFPQNKLSTEKSLGEVLSNVTLSNALIMDNVLLANGCKNLGFISYAPNKSARNYPELTSGGVTEFFGALVALADYIIVDTTSRSSNLLDKYAIENANFQYRITTADLKGLAFRETNKSISAIDIMLCNNRFNPTEDIASTFDKKLKYTLPRCKTLDPLYNGVNGDDVDCPKAYKKVLGKIIESTLQSKEGNE